MLELISFVGVDEQTNLDKLVSFDFNSYERFLNLNADVCPFIEYGFLYSEKRSLTNDKRYPTYKFINDSLKFLDSNNVATSVHLCGQEAIDKYLKKSPEIFDLLQFSRVQLNFSMSNYDVDELLENILEVCHEHPMPLIVQSNKSKAEFINKLLKKASVLKAAGEILPNIDILHDGSGGFGREIEIVQAPYEDIMTGYAGGLKPGNIKKVLGLIDATIASPDDDDSYHKQLTAEYYIDMESGVRNDNVFSLNKCEEVINEVVEYFVENQ
jgi:phosphoribosylanthranilate isomerase